MRSRGTEEAMSNYCFSTIRVSHVGGSHIRWPNWMTSHPVLREIPSDLNYIPIVSHLVDHLESGGKIYTSTSKLSLEKKHGGKM